MWPLVKGEDVRQALFVLSLCSNPEIGKLCGDSLVAYSSEIKQTYGEWNDSPFG